MNQPLVSIITPCYNGEQYLDRYFQAVLAQTYENIELIFINDGSTDRTDDLAKKYWPQLEQRGIRFTYLVQEKNQGQAAGLNRGLKLFSGEYLTWPDADDEITADCIEKKVRYLQAHPEYQMVRSDGIYFNEDTKAQRNIAHESDKHPQKIFEQLLLVHTYGCCGCYMITKELLLKCYPDRDIFESRVGQNWQLLVPAASYSECGYIDEPLYIVYEHGDSHSRSAQNFYQRWDRFTEVLTHAIKVSQCDQEKYVHLAAENNARQKFYYAVSSGDRKILRAMFKELTHIGNASAKERLLYWKHYLCP